MSYAGAINQLTRSLACEWARDNIRTNCVVPAATMTPLLENVSTFFLFFRILIKFTIFYNLNDEFTFYLIESKISNLVSINSFLFLLWFFLLFLFSFKSLRLLPMTIIGTQRES
jgi:hypothetical protein